jgi:hypothetical protein
MVAQEQRSSKGRHVVVDFKGGQSQFKKQADSPAAPLGMAQASERFARDQDLWIDQGRKGLQPWAPQDSMMEVAPQWYTGANAGGTENGWNTDFYNQMIKQSNVWQQKAFDEDRASVFFSQFDPGADTEGYKATGVVTWDDEKKDLRFGDIFVNGQKQGNVYDTFDAKTADTMMSDFVMTREEKGREFEALRSNPEALSLAVNAKRSERSEQALYAPQAEQYKDDLEATENRFEGWQNNALIAGAGLTTAAQGAAFGSIGGPVGAAIGGVIGFGLGTVAGYLNQDELVETAARASVIASRANARYEGTDQLFGGAGTWLQQYAQVGTKLMNVTQNLSHGMSEVGFGDIGDNTVAFYDTNPDGSRKAPGWVQVLDVGAALADGVMQFSNPAGRAMYMGTMSAMTIGGVGQLVVGEGWNEARGDFDPYTTRQEWVGAIGKTTIDALQVGMAGAIGRAAQASRASAATATARTTPGQSADDLATAAAPKILGKVTDKPLQYTTLRDVQERVTTKVADAVLPTRTRDWLASRADDEVLNGMRFRRDADGNIVKISPTLQLAAPSEFLRMVPTSYLARQARMLDDGTASFMDDYYNAAVGMTRQGSRFRDALITGYAEGGEEFIQAAFEPMSLSEDLDPAQMAWAAAYGFAGGMGMGLGTLNKRATSDQVVNNRARLLYAMRMSGNPPTEQEWKQITSGMTKSEIEKLAIATPKEDAEVRALMNMLNEGQKMASFDSPVAREIQDLLRQNAVAADTRKKDSIGGKSSLLTGRSSSRVVLEDGRVDGNEFAVNAAVMSMESVMENLLTNVDGLQTQRERAQQLLDTYTQELAAAQAAGDTDAAAQAQDNIRVANDTIADLAETVQAAEMLVGTRQKPGLLYDLYLKYVQISFDDTAAKTEATRVFNEKLNWVFEKKFKVKDPATGNLVPVTDSMAEAMRKVVELKMVRNPLTGQGSFAVFVPQVSLVMSAADIHGTMSFDESVLKTLNGDHDGDNAVEIASTYEPPEQLANIRRGNQYAQRNTTWVDDQGTVVGSDTGWEINIGVPDAEAIYIEAFSDPLNPSDLHDKVVLGLLRLSARLEQRYGRVLQPAKEFRALLKQFQANVLANVTDARTILVKGMYDLGGEALLAMGDSTGRPEALQIWNMISVEFDAIQQEFAYWRDVNREDVIVNPLKPAVPAPSSVLKRVARWMAKTHGDALMMLGSAAQTRPEQFLHYSALYNSATVLGAMDADQMADAVAGQAKLVELYAKLGAGKTQSDSEGMLGRDRIQERTVYWLKQIIASEGIAGKFPNLSETELLLYVANMRVPAVVKDGGVFGIVPGEQVSMLQMLLGKSLDVELEMQEGADPDSPIMKKIQTLRPLTRNNAKQGGNSNTAALAMMEVFSDTSLYELLGKASMYIGPHVTLRQLMELSLSKNEKDRAAFMAMLRRAADYSKKHGIGNPPWGADVLTQTGPDGALQMNSYTMLIDALGTSTSAEQKKRQDRSDKARRQFENGLKDLSEMIDAWAMLYPSLDASDRRAVLNDMLRTGDERVARKIAAMIPNGAALGVVEVVGGEVHMRDWVEQALTETDPKKAALIWHVNTLIAEWNVMANTPTKDKLEDGVEGVVRWDQIQSRFLQTAYILNTLEDGGRQRQLFWEAVARAQSIEELYTQINANPVWLAGRPELLPFDDDKAGYEVNARNQWGAGNSQQQVLDAIADFSQMAEPMSKALVQRKADSDSNARITTAMQEELAWQKDEIAARIAENNKKPVSQRQTVEEIRAEVQNTGKDTNSAEMLGFLRRAIRNAQAFPDGVGPNAMQQLYTAMYDMFFRAHDKGLPPDLTRPMGEAITMADMWGFGNALRAESAALTTLSWDQVATNLSKLAKGPVRIQLENGRLVELDMSDEETALQMLHDPRTQEFAKLVLFPTMRDVNPVGTVQTYSNGVQTSNIGHLLQDTSFASLFNPTADEPELRRAYRYISMVEAFIRNAAVEEGTAEAWEDGFFPISNMIDSFIVAYTTAESVTEQSLQQVRDKLVIGVYRVLKSLANVQKASLPDLQQLISAELQKRFWGDDTAYLEYIAPMSDAEKQLHEDTVRDLMGLAAVDRFEEARIQLKSATDPVVRAELERRMQEAQDGIDHAKNADLSDLLAFRSRMEYASVLKTFQLSHGRSADDKKFDFVKKTAIVQFLGTQERINKFAGYKAKIDTTPGTEQNIYQLLAKFRELVWTNNDSRVFSEQTADVLTPEQWDQLGEFCATLTISERSVRSSDDTRVLPIILGKNVDDVRKLYDTSWASLSDPLFHPRVLDAVEAIAATTLDPRMTRMDEAAEQILTELYPQNRLGQWHDRIPMHLAKARKLLDGASVEAAVQMEGVTNDEMDVWIATGFATSEDVDLAAHTTTREFVLDPNTSLDLQDYLDREAYLRIHNHAVWEVNITPADTGVPVPLRDIVGDTIMLDENTRSSPLKSLNLDVLLKYLTKNPQLIPATGATISITYVDVNKKPPGPEYANNVYFDGVGRASAGRSEVGLIASMLYAVSGVFGTGLQIPLDAITKQGQSFRAFRTSALRRTKDFEENSATLTEMLERKTMALATAMFPHGRLQVDDLTALYKYVKSRHVVMGRNPSTGLKEVWPAEKWIAYESQGGTMPLESLDKAGDPPKFVANSEKVTQRILGRAGYGTDKTYVDIIEMYSTPQYSQERLERLGLGDLGEEVTLEELGNTVLGKVAPVSKARLIASDERTDIRTLRQLRLQEWQGQQAAQDERRFESRRAINDQNEDNKKQLLNMVQAEQLGGKLKYLGLPETMTQDVVNDLLNSHYAKSLEKLMAGSGILFVHEQAASKTSNVGHLVAAKQVEDGFSGMKFPPTYGDGVVIDLQSLLNYAGGMHTKAVEVGTKVVEEYARRGVIVVLASNTKTTLLRQSLSRAMLEGGLGYKDLGNAGQFFVPSTEDEDYVNETVQALESTLVETSPQRADNFELNAWVDWLSELTEGNRVIDPARAKEWRRFSMLLVPKNYSVSVPGTNDLLLFGPPQKGTGETAQFNRIAKQLLAMTDDGDPNSPGFKQLLRQMTDKKYGNEYKDSIPFFKQNPDGTTKVGVKPPEQALKDFFDALKLGKEVFEPGSTVMAGDLYIRVAGDGNVLLQRIGFKLPEKEEHIKNLRQQWQDQEDVDGTPFPKLRVAFGPADVEANWTVPPPLEVEEVDRDRRKLELVGLVTEDAALKLHAEGTGNKTTISFMDPKTGYTSNLSTIAGNTRGIASYTSTEGIASKGSVRGVSHTFRNMFAVTGWDIENELLDVLVPAGVVGTDAERRELLRMLLDGWSKMNHGLTSSQILQLMDQERLLTTFAAELNELFASVMPGAVQPLGIALDTNRSSAIDNIAVAVLAALAAPGVTPDMVLSLPGFLTVPDSNREAMVGFMPAILSQLLNDPRRPEMRQYLLDKANAVFPQITLPDGRVVPEHYFDGDLTFWVRMYQELPDKNGAPQKPKTMLRPMSLQLNNVVASDKNPIGAAYSSFSRESDVSPFNSRITAGAVGGRVLVKQQEVGKKGARRVLPTQQEIIDGENTISLFEDDADTVWRMVSRIMPEDPSFSPFKHLTPLEHVRLDSTTKDMTSYLHVIQRGDTEKERQEWQKAVVLRNKLLDDLGLTHGEWAEIDFLVRQWYGTPGPRTDQTDYTEQVTAKMYIEAVSAMRQNITGPHRLHPLHGAMVPLEHVVFWRKVFEAGVWSPTKQIKRGKFEDVENDWGSWVETLMGQMLESHQEFMAMFLSPLDGFWVTYQGSNPNFNTMSLSVKQEIVAKMMDADGNRPYLSVDPDARVLMQDPAILESMSITHSLLAGLPSDEYMANQLRSIKITEMSDRIAYQKAWLKNNKARPQKKKSVKDYAKNGAQYQESLRDSSLFLRGAVHLSLTTRLFNPALWVSALGESFFRNQIENVTNILSGNNLGRGGKTTAAIGSKLGVEPKFSMEQLKMLDQLATILGDSTEFIGEIFGEMTYKSGLLEPGGTVNAEGQTVPSGGKVSRTLERTATTVSRVMSDPTIGQSQKSVAIRYLAAAIEYLELAPNNVVSVETLVAEMKKDPLWLKKKFSTKKANPHQMGINAVGNIRSQKNTVAAKLFMRPIETLCAQEGFGTWIGHALKIPFLFTRFNVNALTYLTGMTGVDQMVAMTLSGRENPWRSWIVRNRSKDPSLEFKPMDFNDVIETLDLSRLFVRGMVTQAGLFAFGMMGAEILGFGGEDEEEKRRRRQATYLNIPLVYDPQKAANDFRYQDAIFLDDIPMLGTLFKKDESGRAAIVPHWVLRQFTSPLMGVVRFFETGDIRLISQGFLDGVSAIPNSVLSLYRDADLTAKLLQESAEADARVESPERLSTTTLLGISIVGMYEKALIENQFVNGIRSAFDKYDRNPWLVAMTNPKDGGTLDLQQGSSLPQQTDALQQYQKEVPVLDDNGEPVIGADGKPVMEPVSGLAYMTRSGGDAYLHQYAENNATAAVLLSLFTGQITGPSSFARENMVVKTQNVPTEAVDNATLEALVYARFFGAGGSGLLSQDDIGSILKTQAEAADVWWNQGDIDAQSGKLYKEQLQQFDRLKAALIPQLEQRDIAAGVSSSPESLEAEADAMADAMMMGTSISRNGREELSIEGQEAMVKSLMAGLVTLDDPGFQGFYASQEQRDLLQARILDRIVQDGVNRGMTETAAKFRANRYYFGDSTDPSSPGLREILYSNQIPSQPSAEYNQLNATYVIGPDGRPWATPFPRQSIAQALGLPVPAGMIKPANGMSLDERGNAVDDVKNLNTGRASLEPTQVTGQVTPNDSILEQIKKKTYTPKDTISGGGRFSGYRSYGGYSRRGGGGYGGGGGGGFTPNSYITRMSFFTGMSAAQIDSVSMINTNSPLIRRADVRRERVSSERGRLKQWQ